MIKNWLQSGWTSLRRDRRRDVTFSDLPRADIAPHKASPIARRLAMTLAAALDDATRRGASAQAERLVQFIAHPVIDHPIVSAAVARRRLSEGQPEVALRVIEASPQITAELRLLRVITFIELGRGVEAHADLHDWSGSATMPDAARVLFAELSWSSGGACHSRTMLRQRDEPAGDSRIAAMRLLGDTAAGRDNDQCRADAESLIIRSRITDDEAGVQNMIRALGLAPCEAAIHPTAEQVHQLARELAVMPEVLPIIVASQEIETSGFVVRLLIDAIEYALPQLEDDVIPLESLARLSRLIDDTGALDRQADRSVEIKSTPVTTAALVDEIEDNDRTAPVNKKLAWTGESSSGVRRAA